MDDSTNGRAALVYDEMHMRAIVDELKVLATLADARVYSNEVPKFLRGLRGAGGLELVNAFEKKLFHPETAVEKPPRKNVLFWRRK